MKNSHASPTTIARVDQIRARCDESLNQLLDHYRQHAARHDGETACAFADVFAFSRHGLDHTDTAGLLAAAVARIAQAGTQ